MHKPTINDQLMDNCVSFLATQTLHPYFAKQILECISFYPHVFQYIYLKGRDSFLKNTHTTNTIITLKKLKTKLTVIP